MKKTRKQTKRIWDELLSKYVGHTFEKFSREFFEHSSALRWVAMRILLPFAIFYIVVGLLLNESVFDSLFIGLLVFVYSNFLPDLDSLIKITFTDKSSPWHLKYSLLFFAPIYVYYAVSGTANPIYSRKPKCFHSLKVALIFSLFVALVGVIFWRNPLERTVLPIFAFLGFATHLIVDGYIRIPQLNQINK